MKKRRRIEAELNRVDLRSRLRKEALPPHADPALVERQLEASRRLELDGLRVDIAGSAERRRAVRGARREHVR